MMTTNFLFTHNGGLGLGLWCLTPLSTIFQFIDGGNRNTWRKPPTCHNLVKLLTNLITYYVVLSTSRHDQDSNSQR